MQKYVLRVQYFTTPYTNIPEKTLGNVRLRKAKYGRGVYRMEGVKGYLFFYLSKPIVVTSLEVKGMDGKWRTIMVDDPLHWYGMEELAEKTKPGKVLVGGLGMGLILHHLVKRRDISRIVVVEIDPEIIDFVKPHLPVDSRIEIVNDNFFHYILWNSEFFDTAIVDLWILPEDANSDLRRQIASSMVFTRRILKEISPATKVLIWGVRGYMEDD